MKSSLKQSIQRYFQSPWVAGQFTIWITVFVCALITAFVLRITSFDENNIPTTAYIINAIALFLGGYLAGRKAKSKGWIYGGSQGLIYACLLFLLSFLAFDSGLRISPLLLFLWAFGISALGGIFGVNGRE